MSATAPLDGVRVVEIGGAAAMIAGRVLAGLGARVTRIEPPGGDPLAADPRFARSPRYAWGTLDKAIVGLDLASEAGRLRAALAGTDLLIDGLPPGRLAAFGLDPAALRSEFPHLVILSLTHYGQTGPYRDWSGSALTDIAYGGPLLKAGRPTEAPLPPPAELADSIGGVTGALAAVTALLARGEGGEGDWIDCATSEACLANSDWNIPIRSQTGVTMPRDGGGPLYPVFQAGDGWVRIINMSPRQWLAFKAWLGDPLELAGPEWLAPPYRAANADVVNLVFEREIVGRGREELFHEGQRRGVSIVPVYAPEEIAGDAHYAERGALVEVEAEGLGPVRVPRAYVRFGRDVPAGPRPARRLAALDDGSRRGEDLARLDFGALKVVELGSGGVAPEAARYFALLGADVIKVESLTAPDFLRVLGGPDRYELSPPWQSSNRGKRSVELDLKTDEGRRRLFDLVARADVFFENNSGGVCERLGVGYEAVAARNPGIVYASSQILGASGPAMAYSGFGPSNHALSGLAQLWTAPDNPKPEGTNLVHPDHLAGKMLALAALAALGERRRGGRGAFIDLSQSELAMATLAERFIEASLLGRTERRGQAHPTSVPHGVFPTLLPEEWVAIAVETDAQWAGLRRVVGDAEWARGEALATVAGRLAAREAITAGLRAWTAQFTKTAVVAMLQGAGAPAMPLLLPVEQMADVHFNDRGVFDSLHHPLGGWGRFEGLPFRFERFRPRPASRAPLLGEHTEAVLAEWLGAVGVGGG